MDLRVQRTKAAIKEAFLELRRRKPVEKITVTELAKLANINKATFYLHFSDIYQLSDEVEDNFIDEIVQGLEVPDNFADNTRAYSMEMFRAFMDNRKKLTFLFSGSRYSLFSGKIEQRIKAQIFERCPELHTKENDILLTFFIQGVFHTVASCKEESEQEVYGVILRLTGDILVHLKAGEK